MAKPKSIFLVRHGQSIGNVDKEIYKTIPDYAVKLTERGHEQAREAGYKLNDLIYVDNVKFYVSPYFRTRQTFIEILNVLKKESYSGLKYSVYEDVRLIEQVWSGALVTKNMAEIEKERDAFGSFYYQFEQGESCAMVYNRVSGFLDTLYRDFEKEDFPENVIIVLHGMSMRVLLMRWLHYTVEQFEVLANPKNCEIVQLDLETSGERKGKYRLVSDLRTYSTPTHPYQMPI